MSPSADLDLDNGPTDTTVDIAQGNLKAHKAFCNQAHCTAMTNHADLELDTALTDTMGSTVDFAQGGPSGTQRMLQTYPLRSNVKLCTP